MDSLSHRVTDDYNLTSSECLHINATKTIVKEVDAIHDVYPLQTFQVYSYCYNLHTYVPPFFLLSHNVIHVDHNYHAHDLDSSWKVIAIITV